MTFELCNPQANLFLTIIGNSGHFYVEKWRLFFNVKFFPGIQFHTRVYILNAELSYFKNSGLGIGLRNLTVFIQFTTASWLSFINEKKHNKNVLDSSDPSSDPPGWCTSKMEVLRSTLVVLTTYQNLLYRYYYCITL